MLNPAGSRIDLTVLPLCLGHDATLLVNTIKCVLVVPWSVATKKSAMVATSKAAHNYALASLYLYLGCDRLRHYAS